MAENPEDIFNIALQIQDKKGWEKQRILIMEILIRDKFIRH